MNPQTARSNSWQRALLSIGIGLALASALVAASGYDVRAAWAALWTGATGIQTTPAPNPANDIPLPLGVLTLHLNRYNLAQSLARVAPLTLTGLAVAVGLRGGLFNIGGQGQMIVGALAAAVAGRWSGLPTLVHAPLALGMGVLAGAGWGTLAGWLKARHNVHEVLSTILLNYIAANLARYLTVHNLQDPASMGPQTAETLASSWLTPVVPGANLTAGLLIALLVAGAVGFGVQRTAVGYALRAVGAGREAARTNGIAVAQVQMGALLFSGGLAGLAGALEIASVHHRYFDGVVGSYGLDGIAVALLGGLNSGAVVLSALFFGFLTEGAAVMSVATDVPVSLAIVVQAIVILLMAVRGNGGWLRTKPASRSGKEASHDGSS